MPTRMRSLLLAALVPALALTAVPAAVATQTETRLQQQIDAAAAAEDRLAELEADFQLAVDEFNRASEELEALEADVARRRSDVERYRALSADARDQLSRSARGLYMSGVQGELAGLLVGVDASEVTRRLTLLEAARTSRLAAAEGYANDQQRYEASLELLEQAREEADAKRREVAELRADIERRVASQEDEIRELEADIARQAELRAERERRLVAVREERARREAAARAERERRARAEAAAASRSRQGSGSGSGSGSGGGSGGGEEAPAERAEPAPTSQPASGKAAIAVQTALAQVGKPYQWGGSGPNSFDCSGLTSYAWRAAGVSLPHNSQMQYNATARVSRNDLRPGDLLFFYSPISHVGIYIGDGKMVDAPYSGKNVRVRSIFRGNFVGAGRPRY